MELFLILDTWSSHWSQFNFSKLTSIFRTFWKKNQK